MAVEWDDIAKGLVAGWLIDQVDARGAIPIWGGSAIGVIGLVLLLVAGGFVRGIGLLLIFVGLIIVMLTMLVRAAARAAIRRFASPSSLAEKRGEIQHALDDADLPSGPISIVRFLNRLRRGVGPEVTRLHRVIENLREDLLASENDATTQLENPDGPPTDPPRLPPAVS